MEDLKVRWLIEWLDLLPKQELFIECVLFNPAFRFLWFVGGFGAGKSFIGCICAILLSVLEPNNRGLVARSTLVDLKNTTLYTFREVLDLFHYQEGVHYTYTKSPIPIIRFANGSEIIFSGLDDEVKIKGMELGWFYIDEVDEVKEEIFLILRGRLRLKGIKRYVGFITSNSSGKNWTYNVFIDGKGLSKEEVSEYFVIRSSSYENYKLPASYIKTLETFDENLYKRFVLGEFNIFEGQIYTEFNELIHVKDRVFETFVDPQTFTPVFGLDHGLHNPTAIIEGWIDHLGTIYITWEHYVPMEWVSKHAGSLGARLRENNLTHPVIAGDPSMFSNTQQPTPEKPYPFSVADEYQDYGIHLTPANNEVMAGINRLKDLFKVNKVIIDRQCTNLIDELHKYKWASNLSIDKDKPIKKHDHAVDALRYLVMTKTVWNEQDKEYEDWPLWIIQRDIAKLNEINTMTGKRRSLTQ